LKSFTQVTYRPVGPLTLPRIFMPFSPRLNPLLDTARQHAIEWAGDMGMLDPLPGVPGAGIWERDRVLGFDFPLCAAMLHPGTTGSWLWALASRIQYRIAGRVDFVDMRRNTFGAGLTISPRQLTPGREMAPEVSRTRPMLRLVSAASGCGGFINAVFSYRKEI